MQLSPLRSGPRLGYALAVLVLTVPAVLALPGQAVCQELDESIYEKWEHVSSLRAQGEFEEAVETLNKIIEDYGDSDEILRRAYKDLVFTYYTMHDEERAVAKAREALEKYPDISADTVNFPPWVGNTFDRLRVEMYGSITFKKPKEGQVFLNDEFRGEIGDSPLHLQYVRAGQYALLVAKPGYHDYTENIHVDPGASYSLEISMDRDRDSKWWLYRIGPAVVGSALIAYFIVSSGDDEVPPQEPLPGPPAPPSN